MDTAQQLIAYYQALLITGYATKPKAFATIGALAGGSDGQHGLIANAIYTQVRNGFDLGGLNGNAPAVGKQLDFLGQLIGPTRYLNGLSLTINYGMQLPTYTQILSGTWHGYTTYSAPWPPTTQWLTYEDFTENTLTDAQYRRVLQFQAQVNGLWFSYGIIDELMLDYFGSYVNLIVSGRNAYTYQHLTSDPSNLFSIISQMGLLPAPAGVSVTVQEVANF